MTMINNPANNRIEKCPVCHVGDYRLSSEPNSLGNCPVFQCIECNYSWTCGKTGGTFMKYCK